MGVSIYQIPTGARRHTVMISKPCDNYVELGNRGVLSGPNVGSQGSEACYYKQ